MEKIEQAGKCGLCPGERFYVCHTILAYLSENPDSGDTEDGIQWWLLDRWIRKFRPYVEDVIKELVNEGLVLMCTAGDKRVHYRMNQEKRQDIQKILDFCPTIKEARSE